MITMMRSSSFINRRVFKIAGKSPIIDELYVPLLPHQLDQELYFVKPLVLNFPQLVLVLRSLADQFQANAS